MSPARPLIALSQGDPAGVGPEIIVKALARPDLAALARVVVLGDEVVLGRAGRLLGSSLKINPVAEPEDGLFRPGVIDLIPCSSFGPAEHAFGASSPECGRAAYEAVVRGAGLCLAGRAEALCTAPLAKLSLRAAGHDYPGHTELLAELTGAEEEPVMLLAGPRLRVALATTHLRLTEVAGALSPAKILRVIRLGDQFMRRLGCARPRLAVCGLNPHASEGGLFGPEDHDIVAPAVAAAQDRGLEVQGPEPADSLFHRAVEGEFDLVVALYHDQGLIPLKLLHFRQAVNVTLGLPIVRTSVGHGTAFGLAGRGLADETSLAAALKMAVKLARPEEDLGVWE